MRIQFSEHKHKVFTFEVSIIQGPITQAFIDNNPESPTRTIEILGNQTLENFHEIIFDAYDREDMHLYEFQIGADQPMGDNYDGYGIVFDDDPIETFSDTKKTIDAAKTTIESLALKKDALFFYWFDFGDDWWHVIELIDIKQASSGKKNYPCIISKKGDSPPQYANFDDEIFDDDDDELNLDDDEIVILPRFKEIFQFIENVCQEHLDNEYLDVAKRLLIDIFNTDLAIERSKAQSWSAGVLHVIGFVNFLGDSSFEPHIPLSNLAKFFGVAASTMENKSREIRNELEIIPYEPQYTVKTLVKKNPMFWFVKINGLMVDVRMLPLAEQKKLLKAGHIPFLPDKDRD